MALEQQAPVRTPGRRPPFLSGVVACPASTCVTWATGIKSRTLKGLAAVEPCVALLLRNDVAQLEIAIQCVL